MRYLGPVFLFYFFAELASIIFMVQSIGGLWTLLWLIATFCLGVFMLRNAGFANVLILGSLWKNNTLSFYQAMWPVRFTLAALLFMVPGLISDILALLLILPFKGPKTTQQNFTFGQNNPYQQDSGEDIIEGEFQEVNPKAADKEKPTETKALPDN